MSRILMVAKGSFGDVFPMFALAGALQARGHRVVCAVPARHLERARASGLDARPLAEPPQAPRGRLRRLADTVLSFDNAGLAAEYADLGAVAAGVDVLIGNQIAFVTPLLAEGLGKPWVYCAISPLAVYSRHDPPVFPGLHVLPDFELPGRRAAEYRVARLAAGHWGRGISRLRRRLGLAGRGHPLFEGKFSPDLNLFLCSPSLVRPQPDWPAHTRLTGFCWFEPEFLGVPAERAALADFLARGAPPVLLLLGSDSRTRPGRYYHVGIEACRRLGLRVVAVADPRFHAELPRGDDLLVTGYLPYSELIRAARLVVHSAGIGTLGWCLRHGRYSILTPGAEDQFDNARRAERLGYARVIPRRRFDVDSLAACLGEHLADPAGDAACRRAAAAVCHEDGAASACREVEALLGAAPERR